MEQMSLDLDDRKQYLEAYMKLNSWRASGGHWYVFKAFEPGGFWLGTRHHDLGGTDYSYLVKIDYKEAKWLIYRTDGPRVYEFCDCIRNGKPSDDC